MTILALVSGALFKTPESRQSKAGKTFVSATIKSSDGNAMTFVRLVCFSETVCAELMRLKEGDQLAVQGALKAELYRPDGGEPKVSLSLIADNVLAVRQPKNERAS
jgi:single-stranded DNA-binding protein